MESTNIPTDKIKKPTILARLKKRRWWVAAGAILIVLLVVVFGRSGGADVEYVTAQVQRGTLTQTVEASGELSSLTDVDLSFETSGTISSIPVEVGDEVIEGELLVMMASTDVIAELSRAQETVNLAQANINQLVAGSSDEEVASAQASYDAAEVEYNNAIVVGGLNVDIAAIDLSQSQEDLAQVRVDNDEDTLQAYEDLRSVLRENVIEIRSTLADADQVLGREQIGINDDFDNILASSDSQTLNDANRSYDEAARVRDIVESAVYALSNASTYDELSEVATTAQEALETTADALYDTRRVLDATFANSVNLSKTELDTFKTTIDAGRNTIQSEEESLLTQLQLISATQIASSSAEADALNDYERTLQLYTKSETDRDASVASASATLASRAADLAQVVVATRGVDIAPLQAQLGQARADLDAASARLSKTELRAPITGVVTAVQFDVGELASAGSVVMTVQNTQLDAYMVTVQISESDIAKIEVDQVAEMTFDAFGDDIIVEGRVMAIDPAEQAVEGVVFYEVDVSLGEGIAGMKPGMSVDVTIFTNQLDDTLYVTQRAILEHDNVPYVRIPTDIGYEERTIEKGLRADGGLIQIVSGIEEGESVITSIKEQ
ncbi:efflux RND transporter periplasmic adaptor subunit [Candidatus Uhrbacteria bacterium]|jgi:HlyD family secretion protein|nr:efflux RND transporter periplasmic adaptor subunit [Candidatus Uhrbacteria bacterium]